MKIELKNKKPRPSDFKSWFKENAEEEVKAEMKVKDILLFKELLAQTTGGGYELYKELSSFLEDASEKRLSHTGTLAIFIGDENIEVRKGLFK